MLTRNQARLILSHSEPLLLHQRYRKEFSPNLCCITEGTLRRINIQEQALDDHLETGSNRGEAYAFYDGKDMAVGRIPVHVFAKNKLEQWSGAKWADYESARKDVIKATEVGG